MGSYHKNPPILRRTPPFWFDPFIFLLVFGLYASTLDPSLFRNDSPETITACLTLGVSHPPGYPLHTLLGHVFAMVAPLGNAAMTLNFFSGVLGALGACLLAANLWLMLGEAMQPYRLAATLTGALAFAFSKSFWSASLAAKGGIYVLQVDLELAFFYFLQIYFLGADRGQKGGIHRPLAWLSFLFALGLTNHWPTQVLTLPGLATLLFVKQGVESRIRWKPSPKSLVQTLTCAFLVFGLYLYLPLRANQFPALNFGAPLNWHRFFSCLLRTQYSKIETMASAPPSEFSALPAKALYLSDHFLNEFNGLFLLLAALGVGGLLKKGKEKTLLFLLVLLLTTLGVNVFYLRVLPIEFWHLDDHTLSLNWILGILGGAGIGDVLEWLGARRFFKIRTVARWALCALVAAAFPTLLFFKHRDVDDQRNEFLYWGYGMAALKSMDQNARYFAESDYDYFSILYLKEVEHRRPDVDLRMSTFLSKTDWNHLVREVSSGSAPAAHPLYCAFTNGDFINGYLHHAPTATFKPNGTIIEFMPTRAALRKRPALEPLDDFWDRYLAPGHRSTNPINGLILELCAHPYLTAADYLGLKGDYFHWDDLYDKGLSLIRENPWLAEAWEARAEGDAAQGKKRGAAAAYVMSAMEYQSAGRTEAARANLKKALLLDPFNTELQRTLAGLETP